jgi:hypothetical protein
MKAALFRLPAIGNPRENERRRDGRRSGIVESAREPEFPIGPIASLSTMPTRAQHVEMVIFEDASKDILRRLL